MTHPYDRSYFEDGTTGYALYADFAFNHRKVEKILALEPESVLEIGCARGYIVKRLNDAGVMAYGMDISEHCRATRAHEHFILHDITDTPWPFRDGQFDLVYSCAVLEHIPEDRIDAVVSEIHRVSKRSLHAISFDNIPDDHDATHCNLKPQLYWMAKFDTMVSSFAQARDIVIDKEVWEEKTVNIPGSDGLVKLNVGSYKNMYHHGWINIDVLPLQEYAKASGYSFLQMDVAKAHLYAFHRKTADIILLSHVLEHLDRDTGKDLLDDCRRVLKDGGIIRIAVPDAWEICNKYMGDSILQYGIFNAGVEKARDTADALHRMLMEGHSTVYDGNSLSRLLTGCGFQQVTRSEFNASDSPVIRKQTIDMYPESSLYFEAVNRIDRSKWEDRKMRIALISTPFLKTKPDRYGGLEMVVGDLAESLARMGHDVTVYAAQGSKLQGCNVVETIPAANTTGVDWYETEKQHYEFYKDKLHGYDIVEDNTWLGFAYFEKRKHPEMKLVHKHHGHLNWNDSAVPRMNMISISKFMRKAYLQKGWPSEVIYNGINMAHYKPGSGSRDGLVFVGRIDKFKAPHVAIELAKRTGMRLDIVGGTFVQDKAYLEFIEGLCDGNQIVMHRDLDHESKIGLVRKARAVVFPSAMGEPFGLVSVEAMSCGTPVIATNDGAIPEVVQHGVTGFVCKDMNDMISVVPKLDTIHPQACIDRVATNFTRGIMAEKTLDLYKDVLAGVEW